MPGSTPIPASTTLLVRSKTRCPELHYVTHARICVGAMYVSVYLAPVQPSFGSSTRLIGVTSQVPRFLVNIVSQARRLCLILACLAASTSYLPRTAINPSTLSDSLYPHLCFQRRLRPVTSYAKRPDVALYARCECFSTKLLVK